MADPDFEATMIIWIHDLMSMGVVNPHIMQWTREEYLRGLEFNRDDIREMYGR